MWRRMKYGIQKAADPRKMLLACQYSLACAIEAASLDEVVVEVLIM